MSPETGSGRRFDRAAREKVADAVGLLFKHYLRAKHSFDILPAQGHLRGIGAHGSVNRR
jgi:hypothetical protein